MEIRTKEEFSTPALAKLLYNMAQEAYEHGSPWTKAQFQSDLENPNSEYQLLTEHGPIGYIGFQKILDEVEITNVVINKEYQGNGHGRELLSRFKALLPKEVRKVFLEVRVSNHHATDLYLGEGFEIIARRKDYYHDPTEDALVMEWKVRNPQEDDGIYFSY